MDSSEQVAPQNEQLADDVASAMLGVAAESAPIDDQLLALHQQLREVPCWIPVAEQERQRQEIEAKIAELQRASDEHQRELQQLRGKFESLRRSPVAKPSPVPACAPVEHARSVSRPRERRARRTRAHARASPSGDDPGPDSDSDEPALGGGPQAPAGTAASRCARCGSTGETAYSEAAQAVLCRRCYCRLPSAQYRPPRTSGQAARAQAARADALRAVRRPCLGPAGRAHRTHGVLPGRDPHRGVLPCVPGRDAARRVRVAPQPEGVHRLPGGWAGALFAWL